MTPLAYQIVKELTLPIRDRTFSDPTGLLPRMSDIHCFELSEVFALIVQLVAEGGKPIIAMARETSFLPASRTWVEWKDPDSGERSGFLLEELGGVAWVCGARRAEGHFASFPIEFTVPLAGSSDMERDGIVRVKGKMPEEHNRAVSLLSLALTGALAFINTPKIIGRRQHMPHRGLERRLVAQRRAIGKFPLHAWTEIKLHVTPPHDASGEKSTEAHLTGERALHFCRAHLRIRLGKLEVVRGHWRGDASLGIRRSRYVLKADGSARA
ncbi:hypothetical protein NVS89_22580 [Ancylobacter sp. MQZ15Z-1]|uniref:Uncharacterized protein n=1 Tax=Ancylobacter mangrovi TaxID=2972472 RepID=A0A9X2PIU2_9HYPH|nr:hypothetical protein [Ancylobacter mangrovi]MCS0497881.1 hypothetical protein [Ancylobacter mangrovi]